MIGVFCLEQGNFNDTNSIFFSKYIYIYIYIYRCIFKDNTSNDLSVAYFSSSSKGYFNNSLFMQDFSLTTCKRLNISITSYIYKNLKVLSG